MGGTLGMLAGFSFIVLDPIYTKFLVKLNYFLASTFSLPLASDASTLVTSNHGNKSSKGLRSNLP